MTDPRDSQPNEEVTVFICGPSTCEHVWDGPMVPIQGTTGQPAGYTVSCSRWSNGCRSFR